MYLGNWGLPEFCLQILIVKTHLRKKAKAAAGHYVSCGHGVLVPGKIQGTGRLYFKPDQSKFWTLTESLVPTEARVCPMCGYVHLFAKTTKLQHITGKDQK